MTRLRPTSVRLGVLAAAGALAVTGCGAQSVSPVLSMVALVRDGAQATLSQKTADMTLSGKITAAGHTVNITGTGQSDFNAHAMKISMQMAVAGQKITEAERLVAGHMYITFDFAGHTLKQLTGSDWYELPIPLGGPSSAGVGDPSQMLAMAQQEGAKVVSLGELTINGFQTAGYSVTPSRAAMIAQAKTKLKYLPAAERPVVERTLATMTPPTVQLWFDKSDHLLRRMNTQMSLTFAPGATGGGNVQFDFTNYGSPVDITAPAPSDVSTKMPGL